MQDTPPSPVGLLHVHLRLPLCHSLKDKRSIIKRCINDIKKRFNVSVAEVGDQDQWGSAIIACTTVANERTRVEKILRQIQAKWDSNSDVEVIDSRFEII